MDVVDEPTPSFCLVALGKQCLGNTMQRSEHTNGKVGNKSATCVPDGTVSIGKAPPRSASAQMAIFAVPTSAKVLK